MASDKRFKKGSALVMAMAMMVLLLIIGNSLLFMSQIYMTYTQTQVNKIVARATADAGLAKAIFEMNKDLGEGSLDDENLPTVENVNLADCRGVYSYQVTKDENGKYNAQAKGVCNQTEQTVFSKLQPVGVFAMGIIVADKLEIKNNALIDAFNSNDLSRIVDGLDIGTLSTGSNKVTIKNNTYVDGSVFVGFGGDPDAVIDYGNNTEITGDFYSIDPDITLADKLIPTLPYKGTLNPSGNITLTSADSGEYDSFTINNNKKVTIEGDVVLYITGDIESKNNTEIKVNADSSVVIYVGGDVVTKNNAEVNNTTKIPANFVIYGGGGSQTFEFKNNADFYGVIYAPKADIEFKNNLDFYGGIVGNTLTAKNNMTFYYDEALEDFAVDNNYIGFKVSGWYEQ